MTGYQDNNNSSLTYGYDANGELTGASGTLNGSSYGVSYSYDANGNRTMTGYQTGTGNELLSDGTYNYTYDKDGNTTLQTNITTGYVTYYSWDYRNRLTEVKQEDNHGNVLNDEKFTYDVNDNRIGVSLNGVQQLWTVYDGKNPYIDFDGSGTLTQRYLTNPNALSQFYGQVSASGTVQWFLTDNINSIRLVVDSSGNVLDAITYDPYGNILNQTNAANAPRFLYTGAAVDSLTGNYLLKYRLYVPAIGRFSIPDPTAFAAGDTDLYRYVFNSPINKADPTGLGPWPGDKRRPLIPGGPKNLLDPILSKKPLPPRPPRGSHRFKVPIIGLGTWRPPIGLIGGPPNKTGPYGPIAEVHGLPGRGEAQIMWYIGIDWRALWKGEWGIHWHPNEISPAGPNWGWHGSGPEIPGGN